MPLFRSAPALRVVGSTIPGRARVRRLRWRAIAWSGLALWGLLAMGCKDDGSLASSIPPAEAYEHPSTFTGEWIGEVEGEVGALSITSLGQGRYRGFYEGEEVEVEYVLLLEQDLIPVGSAGELVPGNRALFTWQDGHGGRGEGWVLINREDSALTGAFGERGLLERTLTFIRVE